MAALRTHVLTTRVTNQTHNALHQITRQTGWTTSRIINEAIRHYIRTGNPPADQSPDRKTSSPDPT